VAIAALVAAFALTACGDDDDDDTAATETAAETTSEMTEDQASSGGGETIAISESDFKLDPADVEAKAGSITFELTNDGETEHNLEVEGNGIEEVSDTITAGQSTKFTVDLEPGTYEIYCAIGSHKDLGMEGELTVN
jgi:plastocyanin